MLPVHGVEAPVASTGSRFEADPIKHRDLAVSVPDQLLPLKASRRLGHAGAPDAQHVREELVRQLEGVAMGPILSHQEPPRQPLVEMVKAVASGGLGEL